MDRTPAERRHTHPGTLRHIQLKAAATRAPVPDCLYLGSLGHCVPVAEIDRPEVAVLVIEDLCWRISMAEWAARRPSIWRRRARVAWRADGELLQAKRDRVAMMACGSGCGRSCSGVQT